MNTIIALIGVAIFGAALYGIFVHNKKSTPSTHGHTGGGVVIGGDASSKPNDAIPSNPDGRELLK